MNVTRFYKRKPLKGTPNQDPIWVMERIEAGVHVKTVLLQPGLTATAVLEAPDPRQFAATLLASSTGLTDAERKKVLRLTALLAPRDRQPVWAAGVTYKVSEVGRMKESHFAGECYRRAYDSANLPELFPKTDDMPELRISGPGGRLMITWESDWTVSEPEAALVLPSTMKVENSMITILNDFSCRRKEGNNPLYLPQAKIHDDCAGLGPCLVLFDEVVPSEIEIAIEIWRGQEISFDGAARLTDLNRTLEELAMHLAKDRTFPYGAILSTGTCIVPPEEPMWSHEDGDVVHIDITGVGRQTRTVYRNESVIGSQPIDILAAA